MNMQICWPQAEQRRQGKGAWPAPGALRADSEKSSRNMRDNARMSEVLHYYGCQYDITSSSRCSVGFWSDGDGGHPRTVIAGLSPGGCKRDGGGACWGCRKGVVCRKQTKQRQRQQQSKQITCYPKMLKHLETSNTQ